MKNTKNRKVRQNEDGKQPALVSVPGKRQVSLRTLAGRRGFGLNEVIGIAAAIIIAAVIVIPGLQAFATSLISDLDSWWTSMASTIFATS